MAPDSPDPARLAIESPLRITTAILVLASLAMPAWEQVPFTDVPAATAGRLFLVAALLALLGELRGLGATWAVARKIFVGPGRMLVLGGALLVVLVIISSHTRGCQCSGGAYGVYELAGWATLVAIVVLTDTRSSVPLLGAAALGCFAGGVDALAGIHGASHMNASNQRLAGSYGNSNFLAATQALALPVALAGVVRLRRPIFRIAAVVVALTLATTLILTYSRAGLLAAAIGSGVTLVLITPQRHRIAVTAGLIGLAGLVWVTLYPTFDRHRTEANFGPTFALRVVDGSGWLPASAGPIRSGPSTILNAGPDVLRVVAHRRGEGASFPLGPVRPLLTYHLRFAARSSTPGLTLHFELDDDVHASPRSQVAPQSAQWRSLELQWRPSRNAAQGRAYFWAGKAGGFDLRSLATWTTSPRHARSLPTRLLGVKRHIDQQLAQIERGYVQARKGAARIALSAFFDHPLFGIGWDKFPTFSSTRSGAGAIATHDEYLRYPAELGALGLLGIVLVCCAGAWAAAVVRAHPLAPVLVGALVAGAISLAFANLMEAPDAAVPIVTALAVIVALASARRSVRQRTRV